MNKELQTPSLRGSSAVVPCGSRPKYLVPFWWVILADYTLAITLHLALAPVAPTLYGAAHAVAHAKQRILEIEKYEFLKF